MDAPSVPETLLGRSWHAPETPLGTPQDGCKTLPRRPKTFPGRQLDAPNALLSPQNVSRSAQTAQRRHPPYEQPLALPPIPDGMVSPSCGNGRPVDSPNIRPPPPPAEMKAPPGFAPPVETIAFKLVSWVSVGFPWLSTVLIGFLCFSVIYLGFH